MQNYYYFFKNHKKHKKIKTTKIIINENEKMFDFIMFVVIIKK